MESIVKEGVCGMIVLSGAWGSGKTVAATTLERPELAVMLDFDQKSEKRCKSLGIDYFAPEGAGLSDYPGLEELCGTLTNMGYEVSFSSIRADRVTPELVRTLKEGGVRSFTIAPEAGSERLRQRIGKGIKDSILWDVVTLLKDSSVGVLKLYFLIGLPGEEDEDVEAIVEL